jgi:FMN phosphatase YigB (HAD superfamily)
MHGAHIARLFPAVTIEDFAAAYGRGKDCYRLAAHTPPYREESTLEIVLRHILPQITETLTSEHAALAASFAHDIDRRVEASVTPVIPAWNLVFKLRQRGVLLGLCSNHYSPGARNFLQKQGYDVLFDAIVFSYEIGFRKPNPMIYDVISHHLNQNHMHDREGPLAKRSCIFVGDSATNDVLTPRQLGMKAFHITRPSMTDEDAYWRRAYDDILTAMKDL